MHGLIQSLRYTVRLLRKSPGFTITAVLILGFGIGANTAVFSLIETVLLKPASYPRPDRLVVVSMPGQNVDVMGVDYPDYLDICAAQHSFNSLSLASGDFLDLTGKEPERLKVIFASPSHFKLTGHPVVLGRTFTDDEDKPGGPLVVVLSERFWRSHFNADPKIIGTNLTLSEQSFQVIGVVRAQADDWGPPPTDLYVPVNVMPIYGYKVFQRDLHQFLCLGRLKDGVSLQQAQADLAVIHNNLIARYPDADKDHGIRVTPLLDTIVSNYSALALLPAVRKAVASVDPDIPVVKASAFDDLIAQKFVTRRLAVLLVSIFSGVALFLSAVGLYGVLAYSVSQRRREIGVRIALGAQGFNILGLVIRQGLRLVFLGLAIGIVSALILTRFIEGVLYGVSGNDPLTLGLVVVVLGLAALVACLLPAVPATRINPITALRE